MSGRASSRERPDGVKVWESVQVSCIRNAAGEITNLLCLREDITERKRLEEELRQSQKMESLGTLAGGIAHDFNNLLAVINGYAELSALHPNDPALPEEPAGDQARRRSGPSGSCARSSPSAARRRSTSRRSTSNQLIRDLTALLSETFPRKVAFSISLHDGLPMLLADQNQLQQVVLNLCVNARDAMPDGGTISVTTSLVAAPRSPTGGGPGQELRLPGGQRHRASAWRPRSRRGSSSRSSRPRLGSEGTGLGLAVVYGIIASHHGFIEVESSAGAGSSFKILMPAGGAGAVTTAPSELSSLPGRDGVPPDRGRRGRAPPHPADRLHPQGLQRHQRQQRTRGDRDPRQPVPQHRRGAARHQHARGLGRRGPPSRSRPTGPSCPSSS
jgi:two-component system, cell cycle sensor histidine kinase and response regulator CckA